MASLLLLLVATGCPTKMLPRAATPEATVPPVDLSTPVPEGHGRLVIDVPDGPVEVRRVRMEAEPVVYADQGPEPSAPTPSTDPLAAPEAVAGDPGPRERWRFFESEEALCPTTPCVVDVPTGNLLLAFPVLGRDGAPGIPELVHVGAQPTVYRRSLDRYEPGSGAALGFGITSVLLGTGSAIAGAVLLPTGLHDDDRGRSLAGGVTLGVGVALLAFGIWLATLGSPTLRPGSSIHFPFQ